MWELTKNKDMESLLRFDWVKDMQGVPQSPVHHAEGDVYIHTGMVLEALVATKEFGELEQQNKEILWTSALMHDIEKRSTTYTDENGNIVSPGHAKKGAITARTILYRDFATPFAIREEIVALVRYHGLPLWIFEKPDPVKALLKASLEVNTKMLATLAKADVLGRICADRNELLYKIALFEELCKQYNCWGKPYGFPSELAKFRYFRKEENSPEYVPFEDTEGEVIIMSGIAGSGKDYYVKKNFPDYKVVSLDDLRRAQKIAYNDSAGNGRMIQEARELAKQYLRAKIPFVWNATNITSQMRTQLVDMLEVYKPKVRMVYVEVPYKMLISQNRNRQFPIPDTAIEKMIDKLEVPKLWEAQKVEYVIK